jgi:hypothetical protein
VALIFEKAVRVMLKASVLRSVLQLRPLHIKIIPMREKDLLLESVLEGLFVFKPCVFCDRGFASYPLWTVL